AFSQVCGDDISLICVLFRMHRDPLAERRIRRHDDVVRNYPAGGRRDERVTVAFLDLEPTCAAVDDPAFARDRLRETCQVAQRMELPLTWETQHRRPSHGRRERQCVLLEGLHTCSACYC